MSTATAARRPGRQARPDNRPIVRPVQTPVARPARAPFVAIVLVLLSLGLGALLLLNTLLAQGSFTLHELNAQVAGLADQEQALQQKAAELASPKRLARRAAELGMVASVNPAFLRTEDGKILGAPVPAASPPPVVVSEADPDTESNAEASAGQRSGEQPASHDKQGKQNKQDKQTGNGNGGADR